MRQWKPLLPFRGSTIIETVVDTALSVCGRIILVAGYRSDELSMLFVDKSRVRIELNSEWSRGMFSSIQCGISHLRTERFFIVPADMPLIGREIYKALLGAPACDAIFPVYDGRRGHPVLFANSIADVVLKENPITGRMRKIAERFEVCEMHCRNEAVLIDIDTMDDYRKWGPFQ